MSRNVGIDDFGNEAPLSMLSSNVCAPFLIRLRVLISFPVLKVILGSLLLEIVYVLSVMYMSPLKALPVFISHLLVLYISLIRGRA